MKISKAIVTGASSGIGLAVCEKLISMGTFVYAITRNPEKIAIRENLFPLKLDLSIPLDLFLLLIIYHGRGISFRSFSIYLCGPDASHAVPVSGSRSLLIQELLAPFLRSLLTR